MKNNFLSLLSALTAVALATFSAAPVMAADQADTDKPAAAISASATVSATVTKIDKKDRWITLKLADGTVRDIQAGPAVKNFAQIHVGDQVTASRSETMAVEVVPGGKAPPNVSGGSSVATAPLGDKPMGVLVENQMVSGRVTAIDYDKRWVKVKGPAGNTHTFEVGPEATRFNAVKVGDDVLLTLKTVTTIEVTTPAKKKSSKPKTSK